MHADHTKPHFELLISLEAMGVYLEIPKEWEVIFVFKNWKFRGGGVLREIPSSVGVWIYSGTKLTLIEHIIG